MVSSSNMFLKALVITTWKDKGNTSTMKHLQIKRFRISASHSLRAEPQRLLSHSLSICAAEVGQVPFFSLLLLDHSSFSTLPSHVG